MASTWRFQQENSTRLARLGLTDPSSGIQSRQMPFVEGGGPDDKQGSVLADALNVHEVTGLTPSQLQARVAELGAALHRTEVAINTLEYCYISRPENFALALTAAKSDALSARDVLDAKP